MTNRGCVLCAGIPALLICLASQSAWASTEDFESFTPGSVNGQGGWTVEDEFGNGHSPAYDQEVVDDGTGNQVFRMSNAVITTGFSDLPFSQLADLPAGETGSALWNDRGTDHTMPLNPPLPRAYAGTPEFHAQFRFRSATGAAQTGMSLNVSPIAKQSSWRTSFVSLTDDGTNGIDLTFFDTGVGGSFEGTQIASDLSYTEWHTIDIYMGFVDGLNPDMSGNDCVIILVNGVEVFAGTTWETFYENSNPANLNPIDQPQLQAVDSLMFRASGTAAPANAGFGYFFDDVVIENDSGPCAPAAIPTVGEWGLLATALLLIGGIAMIIHRVNVRPTIA